jgi:hypothetical protein
MRRLVELKYISEQAAQGIIFSTDFYNESAKKAEATLHQMTRTGS